MNLDRSRGLAIVTYNSEEYFKALYDSIPFSKVDEVVVVNGGKPYEGTYDKVHWIQHTENKFPAACRNEGLQYLIDKNINNLFVCEDDMIFKSEDVFDEYINASQITGLEYFCFASYAWETGPVGARTPKLKVQYSSGPVGLKDAVIKKEVLIHFYAHTCNEFTFRTRKMIDMAGMYDTGYLNTFDIDMIYRMSQTNLCSPFWWFSDLSNSDDLIMNNPVAVSRLDGDGNRASRLQPDYELFIKKHGTHIGGIPLLNQEQLIQKLLDIRNKR